MSQTFNLVCPETRKAIWVGQKHYIYSSPEKLEALAKWLHEHKDKPIVFVSDERPLLDGIEDRDFIGLD